MRGSLDELTGTFGWNLADQRGSVELSARKDGERWNVTVAEGAVLTLPGERWRLDRNTEVNVANAVYGVSPHCWLPPSAKGRVCVDAAVVEGEHIRLAGAIDAFDIAGIASRLEDARRVAGSISGAGMWWATTVTGTRRALETEALRVMKKASRRAVSNCPNSARRWNSRQPGGDAARRCCFRPNRATHHKRLRRNGNFEGRAIVSVRPGLRDVYAAGGRDGRCVGR